MAQLTSIEKKEKNMSLSPSKLSTIVRLIIHPLLLKMAAPKIRYKVEKCCEYNGKTMFFTKDRPIIFACNHSTSYDVPIAFSAIGEHAYLFAGKQPLEAVDELFFNLNGTIYVDRKNKEDMKLSKEAMIETLKNKSNILMFPEGTWNMTDSLPMLEMKWGIIDIAKQSNALIVPMALDYDYDKEVCRYKFGDAIDVNELSLKDGIRTVRDAMASLKWELFELKEHAKREELDTTAEQKKINHSLEEYPKLDAKYEASVVYHSMPSFEEVMEPMYKTR